VFPFFPTQGQVDAPLNPTLAQRFPSTEIDVRPLVVFAAFHDTDVLQALLSCAMVQVDGEAEMEPEGAATVMPIEEKALKLLVSYQPPSRLITV
jgi:hypothetical protein